MRGFGDWLLYVTFEEWGLLYFMKGRNVEERFRGKMQIVFIMKKKKEG